MATTFHTGSSSRTLWWTGWIISGIVVLFLLLDGISKVMMLAPVVDATAKLGYPLDAIRPIGIIDLVCAVLYAVPRTALFGAILVTAFLGGAVASKVRIEEALFGQILFGVYVGILAWGGLYLRDNRLRALLFQRT
ncbi:MAG: hypothetical protein JWN85_919 [Gammaproteobacteria bacterium]|nr:hypothetical protein [Gammaproteobacteria bacterium]